jgi:hypothetical protein
MKIKNQHYRLWAACSLFCVIAACTSNGTNNTENSQDTTVKKQYGQQPRDSSTATLSAADSAKNVKTNKGNVDPSGRQKNQ